MPPARLALTAKEPQLAMPDVAKGGYLAGQALSSSGPALATAFGFMGNHSGVVVSPATALQATAVYACVRCLSEDLAKLPLLVSRAGAKGGWVTDPGHWLAALLREPNRWQTTFTFVSFIVTCLQLRGNAYVLIARDGDGQPRALIPISPDRCTTRLSPQGWLYYDVWHPAFQNRGSLTVHQDDMLHIRNITLDGFMGVGPITAAAEAIGLSLATQVHGATLFRNGTQATGTLESDHILSDVARNNLIESFRQRYSGVENANKVLLLEEGLKFNKLSMTADEAQFLETRKFQVEEICRVFRVPPHKIASLDRATFSNIENQNQQYIDDSLIPMARQFEEEAERKLLWDGERGGVRLRVDFDSLLRGDFRARADAYHIALGDGWLNRDTVRERENLPPIPDGSGQDYRVALNTASTTTPTPAAPPATPT